DPAVTTYTWVFDATPGFFEGTRGMFISWPFVAGVAALPDASQIAGHSAFAPNPAVVTSGSVDGSEFFGVPVYAENKDEAWRLLELIASREGQRTIAMGGWGSMYSGIMQEPEVVEAFPFYPALAQAYEYPVDGGWSEDRPRWTQILSDEIHEVLAGNKTPKAALDDAAAAAVEARNQDDG
ncbi:MAG: extracellular solute-binding protein, partial [Acidimicrobiia bacterium]|nr:extracellular solute-binding protein [Acidimicrobiia bacterium]